MSFSIALVGNPNSGKTTLFNALTGSNQHVGNWPGVTVERKEAIFQIENEEALLVDLPGIYSLHPYSIEERIAKEYLTRDHPDVVINIVDATNLERNLYLTLQLMELKRPLVVALNLIDELNKRKIYIDAKRLSRALGVPVVCISAKQKLGFDELFRAVYAQIHAPATADPVARYNAATKCAVRAVSALAPIKDGRAAIRVLEEDCEENELSQISKSYIAQGIRALGTAQRDALEGDVAMSVQLLLASARYALIDQILAQAGLKALVADRKTASETIDGVLTHKYLALPALVAVLGVVFLLTFGFPGATLSAVVAVVIDVVRQSAQTMLDLSGSPAWATALLTDGVITGVGGVLSFLPQILLVFLFMAILEDCGYMSRAAFIADRPLRALGLSGRSVIPLLMGFGCTTTAVIAARGVENQRDRRLTILLTPFMSCGAKLPIYALFVAAFFSGFSALVVLGLYLLGVIMLIIAGLILRRFSFARGESPFGMELPPYRMPSAENVLRQLKVRASDFIKRAGTLIFAMSVLAWFLQSFGFNMVMVQDSADSMLGRIGALIAPVLRPLGFGQWEKSVSLLSGLVAKEAVVSTMQVLYGAGSIAELSRGIAAQFTPLSACSFLVFTLLYTPCISAIAAIRRETGSKKLMWLSVGMQMTFAYISAFAVYQIGSLLGGG